MSRTIEAATAAASLVFSLPGAPALAQDPATAPSIDRTVVVTATREPQPAVDVLAPLVIIDRAAIERSLAPDLGDLLRTVGPGRRRRCSSAARSRTTRS